jgi:hypothetical protein
LRELGCALALGFQALLLFGCAAPCVFGLLALLLGEGTLLRDFLLLPALFIEGALALGCIVGRGGIGNLDPTPARGARCPTAAQTAALSAAIYASYSVKHRAGSRARAAATRARDLTGAEGRQRGDNKKDEQVPRVQTPGCHLDFPLDG